MRMIGVMLTAVACVAFAIPASAGSWGGFCDQAACTDCAAGCGSSCDKCGCKAPSNAYCTVECGTKTVTRPIWKVECEPFCLPKPRCLRQACDSCGDPGCGEAGCDECGEDCTSCCGDVHVEKVPKCGKVRVRKRLLRSECEIEVPTYHCVVKYCCPSCVQDPGCCGAVEAEAEEEAPAPPAPDA